MSLSKNSILPIQNSTFAIKTKYPCVYTSSWSGYNVGITFISSSIGANFGMNNDYTRNDLTGSWSRWYRTVKHLYYENYLTGSVLNSASYFDPSSQSTACSSSTEYEYRYLPTGAEERIAVIYIPPDIAGEQISRLTFNLRPIIGNEYNIWDDGNGNLLDRQNGNLHVGNILYSQGVIIITNPDYAPGFVVPTAPPPPYYFPTNSISSPAVGYTDSNSTNQYVQFTDDVWP